MSSRLTSLAALAALFALSTAVQAATGYAGAPGEQRDFLYDGGYDYGEREPAVAMTPRGDGALVWVQTTEALSGRGLYLRLVSASDLQHAAATLRLAPDGARAPSVALAADGSGVAVWTEGAVPTVMARRFDAQGAALGAAFRVNADPSAVSAQPVVRAALDGRFVVAWESGSVGDRDVRVACFAADGSQNGAEFSPHPVTTGEHRHPSLSVGHDGRFVVGWTDPDADGDGTAAVIRRHGADCLPSAAPTVVSTTVAGDQRRPSVGLSVTGRLVVAWDGAGGDEHQGGFFQVYDATGAAVGTERPLSEYAYYPVAYQPVVAVDADGDFAIAWQRPWADEEPTLVSAMRRYNADGSGAYVPGSEYGHDTAPGFTLGLAADADGDLLIASWDEAPRGDIVRTWLSVSMQSIDLAVSISAPTTMEGAAAQTLDIEVRNLRTPESFIGVPQIDAAIGLAADVSLNVYFSQYLSLVDANTGSTVGGYSGGIPLGALAAGEVRRFRWQGRFSDYYEFASVQLFANLAQHDGTGGNNMTIHRTTLTPATTDAALTLTAPNVLKGKFKRKSNYTFRFGVVQGEPRRYLRGTTVRFTLPKQFTYVSGTIQGANCQGAGSLVTCRSGDGQHDANHSYSGELILTAAKAGKATIIGNLTTINPDTAPVNNTAQVKVTVK